MRDRINIVGKIIGRLTVLKMIATSGRPTRCKVRCECGTVKELSVSCMLHGKTRSCGCLRKERVGKRATKHGLHKHRAYNTWISMHKRCYEKTSGAYPNYGGRGIMVCKKWHRDNPNGLSNFCSWYDAQDPQPGLTVDRKNNNRGYMPSNCRMATPKEQAANRRR